MKSLKVIVLKKSILLIKISIIYINYINDYLQVQKEREAEGQEFADKETFVTTSYRKKLEELKKLDDEEKREDYLEAIGDVTKQQDLGIIIHIFKI